MYDREWRLLSAFHAARWIAWWPRASAHQKFWAGETERYTSWFRGAAPGFEAILGAELVARIASESGPELARACGEAAARLRAENDWLIDPGDDVALLFDGTAAPVAASGAVGEHRFRFRSRHLGWTFGATEAEIDPSNIDGPEDGFFREDDDSFGVDFDPSWLTARQAQEILLRYVSELAAVASP